MRLVAQGQCVEDMSRADSLFQEGESGEVRLYLSRPLTSVELTNLDKKLRESGAVLTGPIQQASTVVSIPFQKELPFLILLAPLAAGLGVLGWQLLKPEFFAGPLVIAGGILLLFAFLIRGKKA